ncbi:MAG: NADAR family protein [Oceanococcus sp.]
MQDCRTLHDGKKSRVFNDHEARNRVIAAESPRAAKSAGREVRNFNQAIWETHRFGIVVEANLHKFSASEPLRSYLIGTGDRVLVEASPVDQIWGIGMNKNDAIGAHPSSWKGSNLLGFALMTVRDELARAI